MKKISVYITGKLDYLCKDEESAKELAIKDIKYLHPKFNISISELRPSSNWESVGIYPLEVSEEEEE